MGAWQVAQQEAGVTGLHHFKADICALNKALADEASVLVSIDFNASDMLPVDQAREVAPCLNPAGPFHAILDPDLIAFARINRGDTDLLLPNAEGVTVDHSRTA